VTLRQLKDHFLHEWAVHLTDEQRVKTFTTPSADRIGGADGAKRKCMAGWHETLHADDEVSISE